MINSQEFNPQRQAINKQGPSNHQKLDTNEPTIVIQQTQNRAIEDNLAIKQNNSADKITLRYKPLVISGCSGVGKGTLIGYLLKKYPDLFQLSVSLTTRSPRPGEVDGRQYHFIDKQHFKNQIQNDVFAEYCEVHGNYYGTHQGKLQQIMSRGKICLLDIDLQGGQKIYKKMPDFNFLFIDPPSFQALQSRLRKRGTESEQAIQKRLKNAKGQLQTIKILPYYEHLINQDLTKTEQELIQFINCKYGINLSQ